MDGVVFGLLVCGLTAVVRARAAARASETAATFSVTADELERMVGDWLKRVVDVGKEEVEGGEELAGIREGLGTKPGVREAQSLGDCAMRAAFIRALQTWMEEGKGPWEESGPGGEEFAREEWVSAAMEERRGGVWGAVQRRDAEGLMGALGVSGVAMMCGMKATRGSKAALPPPRDRLFAAANQPYNASGITVAGRAFSKHAHRASDGFWTSIAPAERAGPLGWNHQALDVLRHILDHAVWWNVHTLPHDVLVYEVRERAGYGARWSADGTTFRGFLEPHMHGGHEVRWRH
jgi:hypothetical protein